MTSLKTILTNRKYFTIAMLFSSFSLIFSSWIIYIPYLSETLGLNEAEIGIGLLSSSVGALLAIVPGKKLLYKFGVGRMAFVTLIIYGLSTINILFSEGLVSLCVSLFVYGIANSIYSLSINSLIAIVEKKDGKAIMSSGHGFFSIGAMVGAGVGSFIVPVISNPVYHISVVFVLVLILQIFNRNLYSGIKGERTEAGVKLKNTLKPLGFIALIGLVFMVSEGAIADWSALYLKKYTDLSLSHIGLGYAGFSLAMTIGRFIGDSLSSKYSSMSIVKGGALIGIMGFVTVLSSSTYVSIAGFTIIGLGFSVVIPVVFRMAANTNGVDAESGTALVIGFGYFGFLFGPFLIGYIAENTSLHFSYSLLMAVMIITLFGCLFYKRNESTIKS